MNATPEKKLNFLQKYGYKYRMRIFLLLALILAALLASSVAWEFRTTPEPALPAPAAQTSYAQPGIHALMEHAAKADPELDLRYTAHVRYMEISRLKQHLQNLGPRMGWRVREIKSGDIAITLPEAALHEVEDLAQDPVGWTLKAIEQGEINRAPAEKLLNVTLEIDRYRGRNPLPVALIIASAGALFATALAGVAVKMTSKEKAR